MFPNAKPSELIAVAGTINPSSQAAGTLTSGWVAAADYEHFLAVLMVGALGASATVAAKIEQATSAGGAGAKDVTGLAITIITTGNNQQALINVDQNDLDINGGFAFIRLSVTVATAATLTSAVLLGCAPNYAPVAQAATVLQTVG